MKKALTLATLILGMMTFAHVCRAESTSFHTTESIEEKHSFSMLAFTAHIQAETSASLLRLDIRKASDNTYLFTFHYSTQIAKVVNILLRFLFVAYIAFLFKKNLPLLIPHHA